VIVGTNLYMVTNKSQFLDNETLFLIFRSKAYRLHILNNSKGSTVKMITKDAVESFELFVPPSDIIEKFESAEKPLTAKLRSSEVEIQSMIKLRDILLPKLMSGKLKIK